MGIGNGSSSDVPIVSLKATQDETTPLLPIKAEEDVDVVHEFNGASFSGAVFNLSTTIVGAGIMALPASIKMLGLIPGILMGDTSGQWGRIALQVSVVINNIGVLVVYMIITAAG